MRRSSLKLVLASTLPLAISACTPAEPKLTFSAKQTFQSVQDCADKKVPVDVCSAAFMQALSDHNRIAPKYDDKAACEADFVPDYCQQTSDGQFMPKLGGFELAISGEIPKKDVDAARHQVEQAGNGFSGGGGGGGGEGSGFLNGLLIGNLLSNRSSGTQFVAQPIYQTRDSRGSYETSTLSRQIDEGKTFSRSMQAKYSSTDTYTQATLGRSLGGGSGTSMSSASSSISRGGFGAQATARSGWSGKSGGSISVGG
ncbi:DUF1190 domain-containing protein [Pseudomonas sp. NPDC089569]|uniref:DUF1190 domain-containing protein n=1 Tax=Pseudomonas sp. NPDC089569 TaxID=3390722 RepID=UPI003CFC40FE